MSRHSAIGPVTPSTTGPQITLFQVLWLFFVFTCAFFAGRNLAHNWGKLGWLVGALIGIGIGYLLLYALGLLDHFYHRLRPLRPSCRQGRCSSADYEISVSKKEARWESEYRCKCGDTYIRRENRFMILSPDGSTQPYMLRKPFHNWEPDVF